MANPSSPRGGRTKQCSNCAKRLPLSAFNRNAARADGASVYCSGCERAYKRRYRERKPSPPPQAPTQVLGVVRTQEEVAAILGISRQMVQKIETQAFRKMRRSLERRWSGTAQGAPLEAEVAGGG